MSAKATATGMGATTGAAPLIVPAWRGRRPDAGVRAQVLPAVQLVRPRGLLGVAR